MSRFGDSEIAKIKDGIADEIDWAWKRAKAELTPMEFMAEVLDVVRRLAEDLAFEEGSERF